MNSFLKVLLSLSVSGSLLIVVLFLCKPLYKNKIRKRWQYYIWLVVIARLLLPFTPEDSLVGSLFRETDRALAPASDVSTPEPQTDSNRQPVEGDRESSVAPYPSPARDIIANIRQNLWLAWLGIALILLIRKITIYQGFVKYIKAGREEISDPAILNRLAQIGEQVKVEKPVELYTNSLISSPLLLGFFRPCLVLPTLDLPDRDFQYTILHELTHYKRRDMFYKWFAQLTLCLHWFNPLVYLMGREIDRACELSCDEAVIQTLDEQGRRAYGDTLLHAMGAGGTYMNSRATLTLNESAKLLKERLEAIMKFRKSSRLISALSLALTAALMLGATTAGAYSGPGMQIQLTHSSTEGDAEKEFRYTQEGYYQAPYLFVLGWNVRESGVKAAASTEITMPDGANMTVWFCEASEGYRKDAEALKALTTLLARLRSETAKTDFPLQRPLVVSVQNTGSDAPAALAEQCYKDGSLPQFAAVFGMLDENTQKLYLDRIFADNEIAFFSASLDQLDKNSALIEQFAEIAYTEKSISFFSVLANHMSEETLESWLARAIRDKRVNFQSVLLSKGNKEQELKDLKESLDAQRVGEYRAHGITKVGTSYFYQGQSVNILLDLQADSAAITLEKNPQGAVNIRITRDSEGEIESVDYMTESEVAGLFGDDEDPDED